MHENIKAALDRADELMVELEAEYRKALRDQAVSADTKQLCHDVIEKLRSALDRIARRYFEVHIAPNLTDEDRRAATIYFPIAADEQGFLSVMGRWRWKAVRGAHSDLENYLRSLQPYSHEANNWLHQLSLLANEGKHVDLAPQTRVESRQVTVSMPGSGSVTYGPGVKFGSGVRILGVPVDPKTQRVVQNTTVTEKITVWVDFTFDRYGISAIGLCREAAKKTRQIVTEMSAKFSV